ncbi:MAG: hypothetical protein IK080_02215 [Clostridia bacterium]|nr:hypothetical protein [Clostridia bacterium]
MKKIVLVLICAALLMSVAFAETSNSDDTALLRQGVGYLRQIITKINEADDEALFAQGIELLRQMDDPDSVNVAAEVFSSLPGAFNSSNYFKLYAQALQDVYAGRYSEALIRLDVLNGDETFPELLASYQLPSGAAVAAYANARMAENEGRYEDAITLYDQAAILDSWDRALSLYDELQKAQTPEPTGTPAPTEAPLPAETPQPAAPQPTAEPPRNEDAHHSVHMVVDADTELRLGPGLSYAGVVSVRAGSELAYMDVSKADKHGALWYYTAWRNNVGWIIEDCVHFEEGEAQDVFVEIADDSISRYTGRYSASASSVRPNNTPPVNAGCAIDHSLSSAWNSYDAIAGQWLEISVQDGRRYQIGGFRIAPGYWTKAFYDNSLPGTVDIYCDNGYVTTVYIQNAWSYQTFLFDAPVTTSFIRLNIRSGYQLGQYADCCITEVELLGPEGGTLHSAALDDWGYSVRRAAEAALGGSIVRGNYGFQVIGLQLLLREGFGVLNGAVDGSFGRGTEAAVNLLADRMREALPGCEPMVSGTVNAAYWRNMLAYMDWLF